MSGTKPKLIARLLEERSIGAAVDMTSWTSDILSALFMTPASSTAMKIGSCNESNISGHVPAFIAKHTPFQVQDMKSYGLLCL